VLEAQITKAVVVQDDKTGGTVLLAVAEYFGEVVNVKVPYNWDTLDIGWFVEELRDKLAKDFDIPVNRVDIKERQLLGKMREYSEFNKRQQQKEVNN